MGVGRADEGNTHVVGPWKSDPVIAWREGADLPPAADLLYVNLPRGRDRAQSLGSLAERLGWSRRTVEAAVQECRLSGRPVASCAQGVYVGELRDIEETMAQLERRLASQYATLRAMRRCRDGLRKVQQTTAVGRGMKITPICEGIVEDEVSGHGVADHRWVLFPSYVALIRWTVSLPNGETWYARSAAWSPLGGLAWEIRSLTVHSSRTIWGHPGTKTMRAGRPVRLRPMVRPPAPARGYQRSPDFHEQMEEIGHRIDRNTALIPWIALMVLVGIVLW